MTRQAIHMLLAVALTATSAVGQWNTTYPTYPTPSVRAAGMAGAFVPLADEPSAVFWNPAGLTRVTYPTISAEMYADSRNNVNLLYAGPLSKTTTGGLSWMHRRNIPDTEDEPVGLDRLDAAIGTRLGDRLGFGIGMTYVNPHYRGGGEGMGVNINAAANVYITQQITASVIAHDIMDTKIYKSGGNIVDLGERSYRWGLAYTPDDHFSIAYQHDHGNHVGVELYPLPSLGLRGGVVKDHGEWGHAFGMSVRVATIRFDYAMTRTLVSNYEHRLSLQIGFPSGYSTVQMQQAQLRPLYASLSKTYAREPVGSIMLSNPSSSPVFTRIEFDIPHHASAPTGKEITIRPYATKRVFLHTVLCPATAMLDDDQPVLGVISLVDPITGETTKRRSVQSYLYRSGALTWDDTRKAAAFVTPDDPVIRDYVRGVLRLWRSQLRTMSRTRQVMTTAALLFSSADAAGITYQVDPNTPYATVHTKRSPLSSLKAMGVSTLKLAVAPVKIATKPVKAIVGRSDSTSEDIVTGVINSLGTLGEESLKFLMYPYQAVVNPESRDVVVDNIQYPAQLLTSRAGDCDDSTVLLCSLLESAGISTAFVESPNHIYMMFDTEIPADESRYLLPGPDSLFFTYNGTYWVPLETTMLSDGFATAWKHAANTLRETAGTSLPAVTISSAWIVYEPATRTDSDSLGIAPPRSASIHARMKKVNTDFNDLWKRSALHTHLIAPLKTNPTDHHRRANAVFWLLEADRNQMADTHLRVLENADYNRPRTLGLRAVYHYRTGNLDKAEATARQALQEAPGIPGLIELHQQLVREKAE
jgi:hypothetical protein